MVVYIYLCVGGAGEYVHVGAWGGQKTSDVWKLELQVVNHPIWVPEIEPRSSASTAWLLAAEPSLQSLHKGTFQRCKYLGIRVWEQSLQLCVQQPLALILRHTAWKLLQHMLGRSLVACAAGAKSSSPDTHALSLGMLIPAVYFPVSSVFSGSYSSRQLLKIFRGLAQVNKLRSSFPKLMKSTYLGYLWCVGFS